MEETMNGVNALLGRTIISTVLSMIATLASPTCVNALLERTIISTKHSSEIIAQEAAEKCQCPTRANDHFYYNEALI